MLSKSVCPSIFGLNIDLCNLQRSSALCRSSIPSWKKHLPTFRMCRVGLSKHLIETRYGICWSLLLIFWHTLVSFAINSISASTLSCQIYMDHAIIILIKALYLFNSHWFQWLLYFNRLAQEFLLNAFNLFCSAF